jgi:HD-like signal output (HDOD) protein/prolyl-tRNA editing enzyme YbaK/EbsC (Cys-tRNA(Pro) deacylase)
VDVPVPASVIQILESANIAYQLKATQARFTSVRSNLAPASDTCAVKSLVLQDNQGRLQVLLPADHMLDLTAIKAQFGRNLESVPARELAPLLQQQNIKMVPAIPEWQGLTTLVDASLLRHQTLWLETGDGEQMLELRQHDFKSIIKNACIGELAVPAPHLPDSAEMDQEQILYSLKNFTTLRIKQRLDETLELPPLPETAQRIIKLRADPDGDISDLANIVELDPALAAQVVSWASSPYYSAPGKIKSVHDAIVRVLGFDMVLNLALGLALGRTMNTSAMSPKQIRDYWQQAVCSAAVVEGLVTSIAREHRPGFGMAYLSGLLNNFGYLILAEVFPPYFGNISRHLEVNPHIPASSVEQHLLGVSSCQIAAWLLEAWHMPQEVITALRHQNNPYYQGEHSAYPKLVFVARQLLANRGFGNGVYQEIPEAVYEELHLDPATAKITVENILESAEDLRAIAEKIQG